MERPIKKITAADLLIKKNLAKNKKEAEALIMSGRILFNEELVRKPGQIFSEPIEIRIKNPRYFVSRGALKLKKAIETFNISLKDRIVLDVGASSGGFTDYVLKNGATNVIAIDVNYGQFDWNLRNNPKVLLFERTNIRTFEKKHLPLTPDLALADLSFISIKKAFSHIYNLLKENGEALLLIKPQFETKKELIGEKGVVTGKEIHLNILKELIIFFINNYDIGFKGITYSPIKGAKGNIEFWFHIIKKTAVKNEKKVKNYDRIFQVAETIVEEAYNKLLEHKY